MTTIQKTLITVTIIVSVGVGIYEAKENAAARAEERTLQQQQAPLVEQIRQLQMERDKATNRLSWLSEELAKTKANNTELLKLRGEVTVLRSERKNSQDLAASNRLMAAAATLPDEELLGTNTFPSAGTIFPLHQVYDATGSQRLTVYNIVRLADAEGYGSDFHSLLLEKKIGSSWRIMRGISKDEFAAADTKIVSDVYNFDSTSGNAIIKIVGKNIPYTWCEWNVISNAQVRVIRLCQRPSEGFEATDN